MSNYRRTPMIHNPRGAFGQAAMPTTAGPGRIPGQAQDQGFGSMNPRGNCGPVVGNAGVPGCGISNVPCGYQVLSGVIRDVPAAAAGGVGQLVTLGMLAGRALAFQPKFVYMFGVGAEPDTSELNTRFEIRDIRVMSNTQLIQPFSQFTTTAPTAGAYSILSDAYNRWDEAVPVSWDTFGPNPGQGIDFDFVSLSDVVQDIHVIMWGDAADPSTVGQCLTSMACR